jgi:hypothetical protein
MTYRTKLPYLFIPAILALALPAFSQDDPGCASDADCSAGYTCLKGMGTSGCNPDAGPCDDTVFEEEFGSCEKLPEECESDADCGEYSSCQSSGVGSCWADSDGNSGCEEPDPDAPKYCGPKTLECETDSDCPDSFECALRESCVAIDCAEGTDCEQPACEPSGGQCVPQEVECEADSDCPSDWSCAVSTGLSCSGGGAAEPAPEPDFDSDVAEGGASSVPPESIPEETCTEVETAGYCLPAGWEDVYATGGDGAVDAGGEPTKGEVETPRDSESGDDDGVGQGSSDDESSSDAGGCSVTTTRSGSPGPLGLLFVLAAPFVFLRRRYLGATH